MNSNEIEELVVRWNDAKIARLECAINPRTHRIEVTREAAANLIRHDLIVSFGSPAQFADWMQDLELIQDDEEREAYIEATSDSAFGQYKAFVA